MQSLARQLIHITGYVVYLKPFTHSIFGGLLLSISTSFLLYDYGRVFGCSGIIHSFVSWIWDEQLQVGIGNARRGIKSIDSVESGLGFGILVGGIILHLIQDWLGVLIGKAIFDEFPSTLPERNSPYFQTYLSHYISQQRLPEVLFLSAGLLTGLGTKLSKGCTSGHMLCGIARFNARSIVSTCIFFGTAVWTARVIRPLVMPFTDGYINQGVENEHQVHHLTAVSYLQMATIIFTPMTIYVALRSKSFLSLFLSTSSYSNLSSSPSAGNHIDKNTSKELEHEPRTNVKPTNETINDHENLLNFVRTTCLGITFAYGLGIATMTRMSVILGFFQFPLPFLNSKETVSIMQEWDPTLLGIIVGGVLPNVLMYLFFVRARIRRWIDVRAGDKDTKGIGSAIASRETENFHHYNAPAAPKPETVHAPIFSDAKSEGWARLPELSALSSRNKQSRTLSNVFSPRLIIGSILFGVGWGLIGICPGPALISLSASSTSLLLSYLKTTIPLLLKLLDSSSVPTWLQKWVEQMSFRGALSEQGHEIWGNVKLIFTWFGGFMIGSMLGKEV